MSGAEALMWANLFAAAALGAAALVRLPTRARARQAVVVGLTAWSVSYVVLAGGMHALVRAFPAAHGLELLGWHLSLCLASTSLLLMSRRVLSFEALAVAIRPGVCGCVVGFVLVALFLSAYPRLAVQASQAGSPALAGGTPEWTAMWILTGGWILLGGAVLAMILRRGVDMCRPPLRTGFRIVLVGICAGVVYLIAGLARLVSLEGEPRVGAVLGAVSLWALAPLGILTGVGLLWSRLHRAVAVAMRPVTRRAALVELAPLARELRRGGPEWSGGNQRSRAGEMLAPRGARARLFHRVIELRDAAWTLSAYVDPPIAQAALEHARSLLPLARDVELAAAVEACWLSYALQARLGAVPTIEAGSDAGLVIVASGQDALRLAVERPIQFSAEVRFLRLVARAWQHPGLRPGFHPPTPPAPQPESGEQSEPHRSSTA